ncbi:hypothetical protein WA026_002829 [Henosepilachna vigintioctopunctata]|uniref:Eukaryotic translation initiation factor 4E transporter n=1 Tax=Henosepilachna vigintioctopunctata TaxID=420089 RepID=A0AAW1TSE6_9CUCU
MSQMEDAKDCELKTETENNDGSVKVDEQIIEGIKISSVPSRSPELADPAILAVREVPKYRYTKAELLSLRDAPLSRRKPDILNNCQSGLPFCWDPAHWNDRKKTTSPTDSGIRNEHQHPADNRRRPGDPRERIRKEYDGIALSPQRRSFNSGCFVPVRDQPPSRSGGPRTLSPIGVGGKADNLHINLREIQTGGNRRIGSGRILRDSWDFNDKSEVADNDYYRSGIQDDRRSFRRDFDMSRDNNKDRRTGGNRFGGRRISGGEKDEEPEWFSGGPSSQNDTIELRGFDEPEKTGNTAKKKLTSSQAKRVREWAKKKNSTSEDKLEEEPANVGQQLSNQSDSKKGSETPTPQDGGGGKGTGSVHNDKEQQQIDNDKENRQILINNVSSSSGMEVINEQSFLFDDIFKCDSISGLLANGATGTAENNSKSRFSRWFKQESPEKTSESRRSSLQEEHLLKNLLNDINEPATVAIPPQIGNSESYFAPISPAAVNSSGGEPGAPRVGQVNIAEIFQRGKRDQVASTKGAPQTDVFQHVKNQIPGGKMLSLNELESRMRKGVDISGNQAQSKTKQEDDMVAFRRLLAQVSGGHAVTANNGSSQQKLPPMSLMEMLSHSQQQDEVQGRLNQQSHLGGGPISPKPPAVGNMHNDFLLKMQQAQQEQLQRQQQINMLSKLMGLQSAATAQHLRASPLQDLAQQQSKELLSRPEAQAILQAMHQRIPSPRELQVHTQNILQRALIKKKLEEQQENFRKKQEMQQPGHSPNNATSNKSISSPTPLAFTPTSVLRKMTADKDDGCKDAKNLDTNKFPQGRAVIGARMQQQTAQHATQWNNQYHSKQPGRPIVKANSTYQNTGPEQFFNAHAQQQFMFNQHHSRLQQGGQQQQNAHGQPQVGGISGQYGQSQKQPPQNAGVPSMGNLGQYSNQSNQPPQQFPQLTQQQLRAQHQQQARPVAANNQPTPQQQQTHQTSQNFPPQQHQQQQNTTWQQFLNAAAQQNHRNQGGRAAVGDGELSPTSNQLARWFSPDLLERARGGELPSTAGLAQHAVSLEEIERQSAPPVHN